MGRDTPRARPFSSQAAECHWECRAWEEDSAQFIHWPEWRHTSEKDISAEPDDLIQVNNSCSVPGSFSNGALYPLPKDHSLKVMVPEKPPAPILDNDETPSPLLSQITGV